MTAAVRSSTPSEQQALSHCMPARNAAHSLASLQGLLNRPTDERSGRNSTGADAPHPAP